MKFVFTVCMESSIKILMDHDFDIGLNITGSNVNLVTKDKSFNDEEQLNSLS